MSNIDDILSDRKQRSPDLANEKWTYYQEWNNALFLHWEVPFDHLRELVPRSLNLDSYNNRFYVSLVAFTMQKIRPKNLPAIKFISDFHEVNLRTYINNDNKSGVYFLSIEAEKWLSVFIARILSGLPYEKSTITFADKKYNSTNSQKRYCLDTEFEVKEQLSDKTELDRWLTERYSLYFNKGPQAYRYDIHHKEWGIKNVDIKKLKLDYKFGDLNLAGIQADLAHFSNGVKVLSGRRIKI